jgi:Ca2+-binding RTX toxin-like protein
LDGTADDWAINGEGVTAMRYRIGTATPVTLGTLAIGVLAMLAWFGSQEPRALAGKGEGGVTCTPHGRVVDITISAGNAATIRRAGPSLDVNGSPCATIDDTLRVSVTGSSGHDVLRVDLRGGPFVHAKTDKRIQFHFDAKRGWDRLGVIGTSERDFIVMGLDGINLAAQRPRPVDVSFEHLERVIISSRGGNDFVSANGGKGTGPTSHLRGRTTVFAGRGKDHVFGSNPSHPRTVKVTGTQCPTTNCVGKDDGVDTLDGGPDVDTIHGLGKGDYLHGQGAKDHLYGGKGTDNCWPNPGRDTMRSCEQVHPTGS